MFTTSELALLLKKYIDGSILPFEQKQLENWIEQDPMHKEYVEQIMQGDLFLDDYEDWLASQNLMNANTLQEIKQRTLKNIHQTEELAKNDPQTASNKPNTINWFKIAASIAAILCLFIGVRFAYQNTTVLNTKENNIVDLDPAVNKTILTLSNGKEIELRSDQQGISLDEGLNYTDGSSVTDLNKNELNKLNATIHVPKGSTYRVVLADGSHIVLNAMSTLTYPLAFRKDSREVTLSGEGYFEIAKQTISGKKVPFIVHTQQQKITVTGTQFNIRAYADEESTISTLIEGGILVSNSQTTMHLKPNDQVTTRTGTMQKQTVDALAYIAWTKDKFLFHETELAVVLKNISRWYDVDIKDQANRDVMYFYGEIARDKKLSEVLRLLEKSGVKFQLQKQDGKHSLTVIK